MWRVFSTEAHALSENSVGFEHGLASLMSGYLQGASMFKVLSHGQSSSWLQASGECFSSSETWLTSAVHGGSLASVIESRTFTKPYQRTWADAAYS